MKLSKLFSAGIIGDALALIAGALTTLAFAPWQIFPLGILTPALLLGLWLPVTPGRAFRRGYLFGLSLFGTGVYWIYISIHTFGDAPIALAGFITGGLIAILAFFPAITGYCLNKFFPTNTNTKIICAFPALWFLFDWIRSWIFTGFPWLYLGYSQMNSPLKGYAPVLSVYGVTLAVTLSSALLVKTILHITRKEKSGVYSSLLFFALLWIVGGILCFIPWTKNIGEPFKVSLVQGNIPQDIKWSPDTLQPTLETYQKLSANHWDSQLVIWPESAIPIAYQSAMDFLNYMDGVAKMHHADFITGIPIRIYGTQSYYNAVIMLGQDSGYYLKRRLVPFGEYVPFRGILHKFLDVLNIPMSDFIPANNPSKPLTVGKIKIAVFICYEIAFPELVLSREDNLNILLTLSNDAWFGHSIAQAQHLQMGQMRALEMGRPVLFVSNNGITAVINAHGDIQSAAPPYETYVLTDTVQPKQGRTLWQRLGTSPLFLLVIYFILLAVRERRGR